MHEIPKMYFNKTSGTFVIVVHGNNFLLLSRPHLALPGQQVRHGVAHRLVHRGAELNLRLRLREQVEDRLKFYDNGEAPKTNIEVMRAAQSTLDKLNIKIDGDEGKLFCLFMFLERLTVLPRTYAHPLRNFGGSYL